MIVRMRLVALIALLLTPPALYLYHMRRYGEHAHDPLRDPWFLWIPPYLVAAFSVFPIRSWQNVIGVVVLLLFGALMLVLLHLFGFAPSSQ